MLIVPLIYRYYSNVIVYIYKKLNINNDLSVIESTLNNDNIKDNFNLYVIMFLHN